MFRLIAFACLSLFLAACSQEQVSSEVAAAETGTIAMDLYKSPTCGCCGFWQEHAEERGFSFTVMNRDNAELTQEKLRRGINLRYQSCHTAVAENGAVFEGHIPAYLVHQYLENPPANTLGLAVPGMPFGSPGMEVGDELAPYDVLLLNSDGTAEVYAHISDKESQYQ
jgi:hypothetical protein